LSPNWLTRGKHTKNKGSKDKLIRLPTHYKNKHEKENNRNENIQN